MGRNTLKLVSHFYHDVLEDILVEYSQCCQIFFLLNMFTGSLRCSQCGSLHGHVVDLDKRLCQYAEMPVGI